MDCVEVCPVDCFYEGENMLAIRPDECIDCGVGRLKVDLARQQIQQCGSWSVAISYIQVRCAQNMRQRKGLAVELVRDDYRQVAVANSRFC